MIASDKQDKCYSFFPSQFPYFDHFSPFFSYVLTLTCSIPGKILILTLILTLPFTSTQAIFPLFNSFFSFVFSIVFFSIFIFVFLHFFLHLYPFFLFLYFCSFFSSPFLSFAAPSYSSASTIHGKNTSPSSVNLISHSGDNILQCLFISIKYLRLYTVYSRCIRYQWCRHCMDLVFSN